MIPPLLSASLAALKQKKVCLANWVAAAERSAAVEGGVPSSEGADLGPAHMAESVGKERSTAIASDMCCNGAKYAAGSAVKREFSAESLRNGLSEIIATPSRRFVLKSSVPRTTSTVCDEPDGGGLRVRSWSSWSGDEAHTMVVPPCDSSPCREHDTCHQGR